MKNKNPEDLSRVNAKIICDLFNNSLIKKGVLTIDQKERSKKIFAKYNDFKHQFKGLYKCLMKK